MFNSLITSLLVWTCPLGYIQIMGLTQLFASPGEYFDHTRPEYSF